MKKILYFVCSVIFFLSFKSNCFASANRVTLNYDSFYDLINQYPVYSEIISGIRQRLDNTEYRYAIYIRSSNSRGCTNPFGAWSQSEYDSSCSISSVMSNGGYKIRVDIYNPIYYNSDDTIQYLYFGIGSGSRNSYSLNGLIMGSEYNSNTINVTSNNVTVNSYLTYIDISSLNDLSLIDSWLSSPSYTNISSKYIAIGGESFTDWTANTVPWFIYKNFKTINKYSYAQGSSLGSLNMRYILNGVTNEFVVNEETEFIIARNQIIPPVVNDLGEGTTTFNGNSIKISSNNFSNSIVCPIDRPFTDNFCYINNSDFVSSSDMTNMNLTLDFDLGNTYVSFEQGHYYSFTFRVSSTSTLNVRAMGVNSGQISTNVVISQVIKHVNGAFTDYQIIFTPNSSFTSSYGLSRIYINFNGFVDSDYDSYSYGAYRNYRYHDFGTTQPSTNDINNDYTINNIDSITSDSSNFFTKFSVNDHGLSTFITAPIRLFQSLRTTTCQNIILPVPHLGNMQLPCISSIFQQNLPELFNIYQLIMSGIICYYIGLNYFRIIKNAFNPEDDRIEVQDL